MRGYCSGRSLVVGHYRAHKSCPGNLNISHLILKISDGIEISFVHAVIMEVFAYFFLRLWARAQGMSTF